jgi:hypothetical protein
MGNSITRGFIGYISKEDLFTELGSKKHAFTFTPLNLTTCDDDSCFTIRKIKTYHNNLGVENCCWYWKYILRRSSS